MILSSLIFYGLKGKRVTENIFFAFQLPGCGDVTVPTLVLSVAWEFSRATLGVKQHSELSQCS